jgi:methionyl-tRNA formyltransferase
MVAGPLRVVFLGTPEFAVPTLEAILASSHKVVGVVTQPDRPRGRGQKTSDSPVKARARQAGVPVLQPAKLRETAFVEALAGLCADVGVVAAYGKILPEATIAAPRLGMINVHASILPRYRGAAPIHRAVIAGERETGVTIMRVVKALDAGAMLAKATRDISPDETSADVEHDLGRLGAALLVRTLDRLAVASVDEIAQDEAQATYAHRLTKDDGIVDWRKSAVDVHNLIRGLYPWPHAFSFLNGERIILLRSHVELESPRERGTQEPEAPEPGTVVTAHGDSLIVATGSGALAVTQLQREGKRPSAVRDFLSGHAVKPGDRFAASA